MIGAHFLLSETRAADSRTESSARCAYLAVVSTEQLHTWFEAEP